MEVEAPAGSETAVAALMALAEHAGLTAPHPHLWLRALVAVQGGADCPAELRRALGTTAPSTSRLCARLESAGLLARHADPKDRRRTLVELSPAGAEEVRSHHARTADLIGAALPASGPEVEAFGVACTIARAHLIRALSSPGS
ncbi:MarR family winged helix-turn-helix transcriptional regulator [Streptomyces sp. AM8-1-1]|uniref:MarR family winged helix-turn-helix transcriptional regulator n=1 Tax=Streptomyces sp. AM8-1-1 TaxID=3075825 RepID=UPI0028C3ACDD|nr:MarR family transcriptional regulator [Streptomyces sp. AM8-1-1]WNO71582.1 MarR family transcriptional regulator [Streptomyces sp. AM8-1-1]